MGVMILSKCYQLQVTAMLNEDTHLKNCSEHISMFLNKVMLGDETLKNLHLGKGYKYYCFSGLYPLEEDKTYKQGRVYVFTLRSADKNFILRMKPLLKKTQGFFTVLATEYQEVKERFINQIYTVTPLVVTVDRDLDRSRHWQLGDDLNILKYNLHNNLKTKYEIFHGEKLIDMENFISGIQFLNEHSVVISYKGGYLMGNKIRLQVKDDEVSQKIASMAHSCGLGEKNGLGMGFCFVD